MKKNEKIKFRDLEKKEKIGFISVFVLLFSFIFIFLFTNFDKIFAIDVPSEFYYYKSSPREVLETGLFLTADVEQSEDIHLYDYTENIDEAEVLFCFNRLNSFAGLY